MASEFLPRILLVDDEPLILEALRLLLEEKGFSCQIATNGFEALKALRPVLPDIVICDLRMPKMSGFELLPIIRRRYPRLGVIVVSSEAPERAHAMGLPMNAYLRKGEYTAKQLFETIRALDAHLRRKHPGSSLNRSTEEKA